MNAAGGAALRSGATLTVASSALQFMPGNRGLSGGTLKLASSVSPGVLWTPGAVGDVTLVSSNVIGAQGLLKIGGGRLVLGGSTQLAGDLSINEGTLALGPGANLSTLGNVNLEEGTTFDLDGGTASVGAVAAAPGSADPVTLLLGSGRLTTNTATDITLRAIVSGSPASVFVKNGSGARCRLAGNLRSVHLS